MIKYLFIFFLLFTLLLGCIKKSPPRIFELEPTTIVEEVESCNISDSCTLIPICSIASYLRTYLYPKMGAPYFNPNNANEFVFFKFYALNNACLVKFDITSKISTTLTTKVNSDGAEPFWASNGNIYYNGDNQQIQQINPSTGTITQLNLRSGEINPKVYGNNVFAVKSITNQPSKYYKNEISGGLHLDSVYTNFRSIESDISTNALFCYADSSFTGYNISLLSYTGQTKTITQLTNFNDRYSLTFVKDIKWHPNNVDVFFIKDEQNGAGNGQELYKINIQSRKLTLVKKTCHWKPFLNFTISPDGKKIIICYENTRVKKQAVYNGCDLELYNYFGIMDINGCNEKVLYKEAN